MRLPARWSGCRRTTPRSLPVSSLRASGRASTRPPSTRSARRHGLTPEGRFEPLGNVHRLRFGGPATYAVLQAANGLAEEPEVIYAEPILAATSEEDAIIPTDFLFPEQWDHALIDMPDAWQALRDMDAARTFGNADIVIAVVDNGDRRDTHPELSGNVSSGNAKQLALFDFANMVGNMSNISLTAAARSRHGLCQRGGGQCQQCLGGGGRVGGHRRCRWQLSPDRHFARRHRSALCRDVSVGRGLQRQQYDDGLPRPARRGGPTSSPTALASASTTRSRDS